MKKFILDTNIVINDPTLLDRWTPTCRVYLPSFILRELNNFGKRSKANLEIAEALHRRIENTTSKGFINFAYIDAKKLKRPSADMMRRNRITTNDYLLATYAYEFSKTREGKNIYLVTDDVALYNYAKSLHMNAMNLKEFVQELSTHRMVSLDSEGASEDIRRYKPGYIIVPCLTGILLSAAAFFLLRNAGYLASNLTGAGMAGLLGVIALVLFQVRQKMRIAFALLELFAGAYLPFLFGAGAEPLPGGVLIPALIALFLLTRGLVDFSAGVKGTYLERYWSILFRQ